MVKKWEEKCKGIFDEFWEPKLKTDLTEEQFEMYPDEEIFKNNIIKFSFRYFPKHHDMSLDVALRGKREKRTAVICYVCEKNFENDEDKRTDHHHFTGEYLGIAHNKCNLNRQIKPVLKICCHNSNYDFPQFVKELLNNYGFESRVDCIPRTKEKFLTASKFLHFGDEIVQDKKTGEKRIRKFEFEIQIIDTLPFLASSLEKVVANLPEEECINLRKEISCGDKIKFNLFREKGVLPYSYLTDESKCLGSLPKQEECNRRPS